MSCQGSASDRALEGYRYGGHITSIFQQIDDWMRNNVNEIIGLHFTDQMPSSDLPQASVMIADLLEQTWGGQSTEGVSATEMNTYFTSNGNSWPTLKQAIDDNARIFVLFDQNLVQDSLLSKPWLHPPPYHTLLPFTWDLGCSHLGRAEEENFCKSTNTDISILSGFTLAVCISVGQTFCNDILANASKTCFNFLRMETKTLNVILVDYVQPEMEQPGSVFSIVSNLNILNTEGESTTNSISTMENQNTATTATTAVIVTNGGISSSLSGRGVLDIISVTLITIISNNFNHHWVLWCLICCVLYVVIFSPLP